MVDSWKELLRTIIFILIVVLPCLINLLDWNLCRSLFWNFFDLCRFFTGDDLMLDRLDFFMCFFCWLLLWCYWSLGFFVFKLKFLLRVQVRRINRTLDSLDFLLLFNFLFLLLWFWGLLWFAVLFWWRLLLDFLFMVFLIFFRNINLSLFRNFVMIIIQVFESFRLLELACHPSFRWCRLMMCHFWWFWLDQRWLSWRRRLSRLLSWLWRLNFFFGLDLFVGVRLSVLVVFQNLLVIVDELFKNLFESLLDEGIVLFNPLGYFVLFPKLRCFFSVFEGV